MADLELILTMLGESSTIRFTKERNSEKFSGLKLDARDGGDAAGVARAHIEKKLHKSIVSKENFLSTPEKRKRLNKS